jgi:succinate dehydrogenase / fumarate reductase, membrane anchor subunit
MEQTIKRDNAGMAWLLQAVSGLLLIVVLGVHMIANHFVVEGGLQTYQDVINYLSNPLIVAVELTFLVVVSSHALLGVRALILDMGIKQSAAKRLTAFLALLGVAIVAYGIILVLRMTGA